jgi:hypothetical protein
VKNTEVIENRPLKTGFGVGFFGVERLGEVVV